MTDGAVLINLCFHGIGRPGRALEPGEARYWISTDDYRRILDAVAGRPEVRISFDDGNWSDVAFGLPALVERGRTATYFVIVGRLGSPGSLDQDALRHLVAAGMTIGSHGMDHVSWRGMDAPTALRELVEAREQLSSLVGRPVEEAAIPRGQYDRATLGLLRRCGYAAVHTSDRTRARAGAWLQPRYSVRAGDTAESIGREVLAAPSLSRRFERRAVNLAKRLR